MEILSIVAKCGANVTGVLHERSAEGSDIIGCYVTVDIETRNFAHIKEIKEELKANGFKLI